MATTCKYCGLQAVQWDEQTTGWRLLNTDGTPHRCAEYEAAHPRQPKAAKRKNPERKGAFLRWYGPRAGRTHALLVEPFVDPDTPAGMYAEPTKSTLQESQKARGVQPL